MSLGHHDHESGDVSKRISFFDASVFDAEWLAHGTPRANQGGFLDTNDHHL
jgi:hypothetical protein